MTLVKWNPRYNVLRPFNEIDRFLDSMFRRTLDGTAISSGDWFPAVEVLQGDKEFTLRVEAPGMGKKDIDVDIQDGVLTISGEKKSDVEDSIDNCYCREISYGKFSRSFRLPDEVEEGKIKANYKNGVLTVSLPTKTPVEPEKVSVTIS
ncbi:MAG: Hsp20/alpha crystallin family protein [Candidatus Marinimicrobia bacterium]|nr:Hsp20/alpha crystallin family protein [Candidatus Neomarinimicrobiota bacterium]